MKQASIGKLCRWSYPGVNEAPGGVHPRFSGHLRTSADICLQFDRSFIVHRPWSGLHLPASADIFGHLNLRP